MSSHEHWEKIYRHKATDEVSWYRPHLEHSLRFITEAGLARDARILDVGGGASTLVDDLLEHGFERVTVLDLSASAIAAAKQRLGARAENVTWIVADVLQLELPEHSIDLWHDRAVFHFLTAEAARERYIVSVRRAVKPNGHVVVATFGPEGPERCSGLPVVRYSAEGIHAEFGGDFEKVASQEEIHHTPSGAEQEFVYCYCRVQRTG